MGKEEKEYYDWANGELEILRGAVLNLSMDIELLIGEIIATHFCRKDDSLKNEFTFVVINSRGLSFYIQSNILSDILKNSYPDLDQSIMDRVSKFREHRNKFAHLRLDSSPMALNDLKNQRGKLRLMEIKNRTIIPRDYHVQEQKNKVQSDRGIVEELVDILREVKKRVQT
jgi:hypothetical protein